MSAARPEVWGIVLAGVNRWDESAIDRALPRPLLPVAHTPLIEHVLRWLRDGGVACATVCPSSASRPIRSALWDGRHLGVEIHYFEDWTPRGPAGCIRDAAAATDATHFVVSDATIIPQVDLADLLTAHERSAAALTVVVQSDGPDSPVERGRLNPAGVYVLARRVLERISAAGYQDIKEVLIPSLHRGGEHVAAYFAPRVSPRVTDVASYLALNRWALEVWGREPEAFADCTRHGEAWVHPAATVDSDARVVGPVLIGPHVRIAGSCTVLGPTVIGAGCVIGPDAVVSRTVMWEDAEVGARACVDRSVLARSATVPEDARVYGLLFDDRRERQRAAARGRGRRHLRPREAAEAHALLAGSGGVRSLAQAGGRVRRESR